MYFNNLFSACKPGDTLLTKMDIHQYGRTCKSGTTVTVIDLTDTDVMIQADAASFFVPKFYFSDVLKKV